MWRLQQTCCRGYNKRVSLVVAILKWCNRNTSIKTWGFNLSHSFALFYSKTVNSYKHSKVWSYFLALPAWQNTVDLTNPQFILHNFTFPHWLSSHLHSQSDKHHRYAPSGRCMASAPVHSASSGMLGCTFPCWATAGPSPTQAMVSA
jgi:hypothetical protein